MRYRVEYGNPTTYARAYELVAARIHAVYVGNVQHLSPARKATITRDAFTKNGQTFTGSDTDAATAFARLPFTRVDRLTVRPFVQTDTETDIVTTGLDYSHDMGCGTMAVDTAFVYVH